MEHSDLLLTLATGLGVALALGYLTHRLGLSTIVGYLLAGVIVGPETPGFVANPELASQMAEIGVVLLMFGVGLQFHWEELLKMRRVALPGSLLLSSSVAVLGTGVGLTQGWGGLGSLIFGLSLSVSSTVVIVRVLSDHHDLHTPAGHIAVGWTVVEDLLSMLMLVLLPILASLGTADAGTPWMPVLAATGKLVALVAVLLWVGGKWIPRLLGRFAATGSRELFTLSVLVVALGVAVMASRLFGASMALGAFLAGMVVGRSEFSYQAGADALPLRDAFAVLFFVSVGMLFDPAVVWRHPGLFLMTLVLVLVGRFLLAFFLVVLLGRPPRLALPVAVLVSQVGEFSFLLATLASGHGMLPELAVQALVGAALVTISLNPLLYRGIARWEAWARRRPDLWKRYERRPVEPEASGLELPSDPTRHRAIIVGYGPVGRTVSRMLEESDFETVVVETNLQTVRDLRTRGHAAIFGDARHADVLTGAGIRRAQGLLFTASSIPDAAEIIRLARQLNPEIRIIARTAYLREAAALNRAGAHAVFSGEGEVALTLTEFMLRELGATAEQIDRERVRIREELFDDPST
jgi:CPA2 family monovalent cation:H+ antiporter-2